MAEEGVLAQQSSRSASSNDETAKGTAAGHDGKMEGEKAANAAEEKKPSKIKAMWAKTGLDLPTFLMMFKGSLPPVIAIALYQSEAFAQQYSTLGYLVAIMSILGFCIMPRGKFIQAMSLNIIGCCLGAAVNLLALYCATQARLHTTPAGGSLTAYNSSASAICAIFLIVQMYLVSVLRASKPQFQFPAIIYSIFVNVSMSYGVSFPTMASAISFMQRLLEAFLTGFAIATGVSFVILPTSSRKVVQKEMTGFFQCVNGMLKAQTAYMKSLEDIDPVANRLKHEEEASTKKQRGKKTLPGPLTTPAAEKVKEVFGQMMQLHTKLNGDITPAKREFAIGKLESHDFTELWKLLRMMFVPVMGLTTCIELVQRRATDLDWSHEGTTAGESQTKHDQINGLHTLMKHLHQPFATVGGDIEQGIQHILLVLELVKPPKKQPDEESKGSEPSPGTAEFTEAFAKKLKDFHKAKEKTLADWCHDHDIKLPPDFFKSSFVWQENWMLPSPEKRERNQRSLFFMLYLEYLLWRTGNAVLDIMLYVDKRKQEGALRHNKLIFPGSKTLYKWLHATFGQEDMSKDTHFVADVDDGGADGLYLGEDFAMRKDAEHLPPTTAFERFGERLRLIPKFFRSDASAFGFRVVCATMTIAIICYLHASQQFFLQNRLLWAQIMVAISLNRTAGQSTFNLALRILGTAIAMIGAYIIWYIVVGHAAGVIVFLWLWTMAAFYFVLKTPKLIIVAILSMVTCVLIIGYELQVQRIGVTASESNGQPAYPAYLLAPYRLATVSGGIFVAFIWTIFPYPVSEHSELRKDLGATLYLMSNFYSIVHETVKARVQGTDGDPNVKGSHAHNLNKARNAVFAKLTLIITTLRTNAAFSKFQLRVGGKFPFEEYEGLIECCGRIVQYTALIGYASSTFSVYTHPGEEKSQWSSDFRKLITSVQVSSHQITSLLSLLSSSLSNGQPLPPYLVNPEPFRIVKQLNAIDPDLLSIRHIAEPEYSSFAVIQICAQAINYDIDKLTQHVRTLVGEIDFSFHAVRSAKESSDSSSSIESEQEKSKAA